jgi:hypothetical protein
MKKKRLKIIVPRIPTTTVEIGKNISLKEKDIFTLNTFTAHDHSDFG